MSCKPPKKSLPPSPVDLCANAKHVHICTIANSQAVDTRDCVGALGTIDVGGIFQSVPHPDFVQRVEICANTAAAQTPQINVLCDPLTGAQVIVVVTFDPNTLLPTIAAYNLDGTAYVGVIASLVSCPGELLDITEGLPWCDAGTTIVPYTVWDVTVSPPVLVSVIWADLTGLVVIPSGAQTPGACSVAVPTNPVMDTNIQVVPQGGVSVGYIFPANVKTINVHNLTQDIILVSVTFAVAATGSLSYHIAPGSSQAVDYDNTFMTQLIITDTGILGNGGGNVIVNIIDD